jgi:2-C-methyl-D-erythritol 4-phosphate cytidylyltransferase
VHDTVKRAIDGVVQSTLDRSELWAVQTPQVFRRAALEGALEAGAQLLRTATDDASLVEAQGGTVRVVASQSENFKVTTPHDLRLAELLLRSPPC